MMMDCNWWRNTINSSNRSSIWNRYGISIIQLVVVTMVIQN